MNIVTLFKTLSDWIFPRFCVACNERLFTSEDILCTRCNLLMPRINCKPFDKGTLSQYIRLKVPIQKAATLFLYQKESPYSCIIKDFKYYANPHTALLMARMAAQELIEDGFFDDIDMIIPVPLTLWKRLRRGYNQTEYLAQGLSKVTSITTNNKLLIRKHSARAQARSTSSQREYNVQNAFSLKYPQRLNGKHILIVDDVITTGSTIAACVKTINETMAQNNQSCYISVFALAWART